MKIGIQVSSNLEKRTGVEEYIYQLLKYLPEIGDFTNHQFFLLAPYHLSEAKIDMGYIPRFLKWPFKKGWTQIRLSWEMLRNKPDILFVPAHTPPSFYPKLVVTIQGLEYKVVPETYPFWERKKTSFLTKRNLRKAEKIIVPSECTKNDLIKFYGVSSKKIFVIPHGISKYKIKNTKYQPQKKYILYLGSGHRRKNIEGLKKAFKILKEKYKIPHELILAGVEKHVDDSQKWDLLINADVFVFPSFYEGFGFPVLEAQSVGVPVVASNTSSFPETLRDSALLINPRNPEEIAEAIYRILSNDKLRNELIKKGQENVKRFSWQNCAQKTLKIITQ